MSQYHRELRKVNTFIREWGPVVTIDEAARILGVTRTRIGQLMKNETLRTVYLLRTRLVAEQDVLAYKRGELRAGDRNYKSK